MSFISLSPAKSAFPTAVCFPGVCSDSGKGLGHDCACVGLGVLGHLSAGPAGGNPLLTGRSENWQCQGCSTVSGDAAPLSPVRNLPHTEGVEGRMGEAGQNEILFATYEENSLFFCSACSSYVSNTDHHLMLNVWNLLTFKWSAFMCWLTFRAEEQRFVHLVVGEPDMWIYKNIEKIYKHSPLISLISTFALQSP